MKIETGYTDLARDTGSRCVVGGRMGASSSAVDASIWRGRSSSIQVRRIGRGSGRTGSNPKLGTGGVGVRSAPRCVRIAHARGRRSREETHEPLDRGAPYL